MTTRGYMEEKKFIMRSISFPAPILLRKSILMCLIWQEEMLSELYLVVLK